MNKILGIIILTFSLSINASEKFKILSIDSLDKMLTKKETQVYLFDVNVESTREHVGIIPGAKLVDSSEKYDLKKDLPSDLNSKLVFYCANTLCSASHITANRAISFGYKNVNVMTEGIYGWKKAGKKIEHIRLPASAKEKVIKEAREVSPKEAQSMQLNKQGIIVDVREQEERHDVIDGALWFPMSKADNSKDWSAFILGLPNGKKVIFHCASGFRSKKIAEKISSEGHEAVYFKGPDQWREAGLPLKSGPAN